jgi:hypothetical protein
LLADNGHEIRRGCDSLLGATNALLSITLSPTIIADASNFRKGDGSKAERRITFEFAKVDSWETKIEKSWSWRGQKAVSKEGRPLSDTALYQVTLQFKVPVDPKTGAFGFKIRAKECKWGKDAQCAVPANLLLRASPF